MSNSKKQGKSLNSGRAAPENWDQFSKRMDKALKAYHEYHSAENMLKAIDERAAARGTTLPEGMTIFNLRQDA